jgi:NADH:ubiquinone reductase (H+-translocating)
MSVRRISVRGRQEHCLIHRIVIVGGGFAGLYAARALKDKPVDVTIIDRRNFHLFQPLLYQVATGGLSAVDIASPLRVALRDAGNVHTLLGEVTGFDLERRAVLTKEREIPYDSLIVATGSRHHYFGHPEWEAFAPGLKTLEDAQEIRRRILTAFEAGEMEPDPARRRAWLTFVIVGGGPTGVELAGALGEIANDTLQGEFRNIHPEEAQIFLVEASPRILAPYPPELSAKAEQSLNKLGVLALTGARVVAIDNDGVDLEVSGTQKHIAVHTVLWAAGVHASELGASLAAQTGAELDRAGRITVEPDLTLPGHPEVFVLGDLAGATTAGTPAEPAVAPVAMQHGRYAARLIEARLEGKSVEAFRYRDRGSMATIGRASAVAVVAGQKLSGWFAWATWLFVHLMYLVGFQNRLLVFIQWAFQYVTFNRRARLITGEPTAAPEQASPRAKPAATAPR